MVKKLGMTGSLFAHCWHHTYTADAHDVAIGYPQSVLLWNGFATHKLLQIPLEERNKVLALIDDVVNYIEHT